MTAIILYLVVSYLTSNFTYRLIEAVEMRAQVEKDGAKRKGKT